MPLAPLPAAPLGLPPPKPPACEVHSPFTDSLIVMLVAARAEVEVVPRASTHLPAAITALLAVACLMYVVLDEVVTVTCFAVLPVVLKTKPLPLIEETTPVRPPKPPIPRPISDALVAEGEADPDAVDVVQSPAGRMVTEVAVTLLGTV